MAEASMQRPLTNQEEVIYLLSAAIASYQRECASEREAPRWGADKSDDIIKESREKVKKLRLIRADLETIFYGEIG